MDGLFSFFFFVKWGLFCEIGPECFEFEISWNFNCCLLSCYFHQLVHLQYLGIFCYLSICYFNFKIISLNLSPVVSLSSLIHVHMSKTPFSFSRTHNLRPWWSAHVFHSRYYSHIEMFGMVFVVSCIGCGHIILLFVTCILFLSLPHYCAKFTQEWSASFHSGKFSYVFAKNRSGRVFVKPLLWSPYHFLTFDCKSVRSSC